MALEDPPDRRGADAVAEFADHRWSAPCATFWNPQAQRIDRAGLIDSRLRLAKHAADSASKALSVIGSMLVGGDSIDDVAVLRGGRHSDV
jgi:hypothetical protein